MSNHVPTTLSAIAKLNGIDIRSLYVLIQPHTELQAQIDFYTKDVVCKGKKLLPPKVVKMIVEAIGEP